MEITTDQVKELRDETGVSIMQCKRALEKAGGDKEKAVELLRKEGVRVAAKKADRELGAGVVEAYIHSTKAVGAMVLLSCETDFVAKNEEFVSLAYDIAMHIAAMDPENAREKLLKQPFIKDADKTIGDLIDGAVQKFGERVEITEYSRFQVK